MISSSTRPLNSIPTESSSLRRLAFLAVILAAACSPPATHRNHVQSSEPGDPHPGRGALVVSVFPTGPGDIYGIEQGDLLIGWRQSGTRGSIGSPFDALRIEDQLGPRGGLVLDIIRHQQSLEINVASGRWEVELAPVPALSTPEEAEDLADDPLRDCWQQLEIARRWLTTEDHHSADREFQSVHSRCATVNQRSAGILFELEGRAWQAARQPKRARTAFLEALEIRRADQDATAVAASLVDVVEVSDFDDRLPLLLEAQQILETTLWRGADLAQVINHLGIVAWEVDRSLDQAEELYRRALEIRQRTIPGSYRVAQSFNNLASCAKEQGRLDHAEQLIARAIELLADVPRLQTARGYALNTLGRVQRDKGSYRQARESWETALEIFRKLDPAGAATAGITNNLGNLSLRVGDFDRARIRYLESLALRRARQDNQARIAESLNNLGGVALEQGHLDDALRSLSEALELKRRFAPESLSHANTLHWIGELYTRLGQFEAAESSIRHGLEIRQRIAPRSTQVADSRISLGRLLVSQGKTDAGISHWRSGLDLLAATRQSFRFSAQERSVLASRFQDHYRDLASILVDQDQPLEAFELLERSRGRALRMMRSRDAPLDSDNDSWNEGPTTTLRQLRRTLDRGTRLVLFSVGKTATLSAVITPHTEDESDPGIAFHRQEIDRPELERRVEHFRALIARGREQSRIEPALIAQASKLFDLLLGPIRTQLESAQRLLIIPDRPLNTLPFTALLESRTPLRFVADWKPVTYAISGTVFRNAKNLRSRQTRSPTIEIFAHSRQNPAAPATAPLSGVRVEGHNLARLFGENARAQFDASASESRLIELFSPATKSLAPSYLHLSAHASTNSRSPLDSALLLAAGGGEDGQLHAWEVIEKLRIDSDLVVLSACETGLGRDLGGEGVLGLSHAFMFAGARAVLSSLWRVPDESTADWMIAFYRALEQGLDRDLAIIAAQRLVRERGPGSAHPYHWAGFQLWSDWG